ncbi:MAG: hypothetical protein CM15mP93_16810 [Thiotrichaceae bacterium]|nr:MAG: hypothetical protein CM15mP93_16810 [Thiotrichaceae bacterium]
MVTLGNYKYYEIPGTEHKELVAKQLLTTSLMFLKGPGFLYQLSFALVFKKFLRLAFEFLKGLVMLINIKNKFKV